MYNTFPWLIENSRAEILKFLLARKQKKNPSGMRHSRSTYLEPFLSLIGLNKKYPWLTQDFEPGSLAKKSSGVLTL
jgi:hypothetical protein